MTWQALVGGLAICILAGCNVKGSASTSTTVTRADGSTYTFHFTEVFRGMFDNVSMSGKSPEHGVECVIKSKSGLFVLTQTQIRHNGTPILDIPADAQRIDLTVDGGQVTAKADGSVLPLLEEEGVDATAGTE